MAESDGEGRRQRVRAAQLDALLAAAVDAIVMIDEQGLVTSFNPAAERMFGYRADEIVGSPVTRLMSEPQRSRHEGYLSRYLQTGQRHVIGIGREVEALKKSGETLPVWLSVGEAIDGAARTFVGIIRDLSAERAAERERRLLEARLTHVGRFSLMGEMAAGIAHEINQPLSAIATYAQAAKRLAAAAEPDRASLAEACSAISEQAQRASQVIENLRTFIRKQAIELETLDLNGVIRDVMSLVEADARAGSIGVTTRFAADLPPVRGDAMQLQQVVLNLTRNAVDAMRDTAHGRRTLDIETRVDERGHVCVVVADAGPGVSSRLGDAIFHPFVTTKREGLGVGLAISRTIVQSHGGSLSFGPRLGGGAVFTVTLPAGAGTEE